MLRGDALAVGRLRPLAGRRAAGRAYHDMSYGYREPRRPVLPDYSPPQLANRVVNASLLRYVDSLRTHGHRAARVDPLDLLQREEVAALNPVRYGLTDPAKEYCIDGIVWTRPPGDDSEARHEWTLEKITEHLRRIYVGRIAYEFMHSPSKTERLWFSHLLEHRDTPAQSDDEKRRIHRLLVESEVFDQFMQAKFPNLKRYGLEGGESMLPAMDALLRVASNAGITNVVLGMPHRGRLNLLTGLLEFPARALFHKVRGGSEIPAELLEAGAFGDVISHLVSNPTLSYGSHDIKVSHLPNPSHLEAVDPVALGKTRAKQFALLKKIFGVQADTHTSHPRKQAEAQAQANAALAEHLGECYPGDKVLCVQMHGDASFTGQGVVMESLGLSNLPHYTVGGTIHLVVNNSIGYTTPASSARSSLYSSDIGKMINAPVLHVNGDYPEDVARAMEIAFKYRDTFRKDIVIDLLVYRRWGHNELDEPAFTQPLMYEKIRSRQSVPAQYEQQLISEGVLDAAAAAAVRSSYKDKLGAELAAAETYAPPALAHEAQWSGIVSTVAAAAGVSEAPVAANPDTGVTKDLMVEVGKASVAVLEGFEIHPRLQRHVKRRVQTLDAGKDIDWATAEALAFGSLMLEGYDIRISGQDVGRGTFSQRHAMLVDQKTEGVIVPLNEFLKSEGRLELANSSLSEFAVLGFEYGVSWERPDILPIWEAQFGDFFNGAQVIIDTYIASGEAKWLKQSGIVLNLPHGLDGAGPEHSSSRIERWLQLTNDSPVYTENENIQNNVNMHVVFPTTPAQYFHLLRRQMKRNYRKPLIVAGPKGLLRAPAATSTVAEMEPGTRFQPVLDDPSVSNPAAVERIYLVSGKFYYELAKARDDVRQQDAARADKIALVRLEELCPFPYARLREVLARYPNAAELRWAQEEPRNNGAWTHVRERVEETVRKLGAEMPVVYCGRPTSAMPAPGTASVYKKEHGTLKEGLFDGL